MTTTTARSVSRLSTGREEERAAQAAAQAAAAAEVRTRIWARLLPYERDFARDYGYQFTPGEVYGLPPIPDEDRGCFLLDDAVDMEEYERRVREQAEQEADEEAEAAEAAEEECAELSYVVRPFSQQQWAEDGFHIIDRRRLRRPTAPPLGSNRQWYEAANEEDESTLWIPAADAARILNLTPSGVRQWKRRTPRRLLPTREGGHDGTYFRLYDVLLRALKLEGGIGWWA